MGAIDGPFDDLPGKKISSEYYGQEIFRISNANANGANTVAMYAATGHPDLSKYYTSGIEYKDWVPDDIKSSTWDVSFDRKGRCGWTTNFFDYAGHKSHAIEVVTEQATKNYLAFLRAMKIPYLVCGKNDLDLNDALVKLKKYFGIDTLAVCGGGIINGAFLQAGLVDQISLVMSPYVSGDPKEKRAFNTFGKLIADKFAIEKTTKIADGAVHLVFKKTNE